MDAYLKLLIVTKWSIDTNIFCMEQLLLLVEPKGILLTVGIFLPKYWFNTSMDIRLGQVEGFISTFSSSFSSNIASLSVEDSIFSLVLVII